MNDKHRYYDLLKESNGQTNELELGERLGLTEEETQRIISQLLAEHKIEYVEHRICNYALVKAVKRRSRIK